MRTIFALNLKQLNGSSLIISYLFMSNTPNKVYIKLIYNQYTFQQNNTNISVASPDFLQT